MTQHYETGNFHQLCQLRSSIFYLLIGIQTTIKSRLFPQ